MSRDYNLSVAQQESLLEDGWPYPDNDFDYLDWLLRLCEEPSEEDFLFTAEELDMIKTADRAKARGQALEAVKRRGERVEDTEHYRRAHYQGNFNIP